MHSTFIVFGLATATLSIAQSTVSLFIPGADPQSLVASIIASDATATTYAFQCAPGTEDDCGFPEVVTLTEGPARAAYTFTPDVDANGTTAFAGYVDCSLGSSSAVCTASYTGTEANFPGLDTETLTGTDYTYMPVVITAGPLNTGSSVSASTTSSNQAAGTNTSGSSTKTSSSTIPSVTRTSSSGTGVAQNTNSAQSGTATSTAGGSVITGNAAWMVGGAALAMAAMA